MIATPQRVSVHPEGPSINQLQWSCAILDAVCGLVATNACGCCAIHCIRSPARDARNCAGRVQQIGLLSAALPSWEAWAMQLSQMWREHLQAGCPPEMRSL